MATVTIVSGPTVSKVSRQAGHDSAQVTWRSDVPFDRYQIRVVPDPASTMAVGALLESGQTPAYEQTGLVAVSPGRAGVLASVLGPPVAGLANTDYTDTISVDELLAAASEGSNILKIFVQDNNGVWST